MNCSNTILCVMLLTLSASACHDESGGSVDGAPGDTPVRFMPELIPEGMLVHSGILSPKLDKFYFTISDQDFTTFDVHVVTREGGSWTRPRPAFFNSTYFEHGTSFTPDGRFIYFSSTRPTPVDHATDTWHIWRSERTNGTWSDPEFVDIPNLRDKLMSHPSLSTDGTLYFHAGSPDYSDLSIYAAAPSGTGFQDAVELPATINSGGVSVTPFIAPDRSYLLFDRVPDLYISYRDDHGGWAAAQPLREAINTRGQGNPFVTPDGQYLFFIAGVEEPSTKPEIWSVFRVSTRSVFEHR